MKIKVIGSLIKAQIIQGDVKSGSRVVITHRGKVKKAIIVRTCSYNAFKVSYDKPALVILGETKRVKGPIFKGQIPELRAISGTQI